MGFLLGKSESRELFNHMAVVMVTRSVCEFIKIVKQHLLSGGDDSLTKNACRHCSDIAILTLKIEPVVFKKKDLL